MIFFCRYFMSILILTSFEVTFRVFELVSLIRFPRYASPDERYRSFLTI